MRTGEAFPDPVAVNARLVQQADRMPQLGRSWYENGFERMLTAKASCFDMLTSRGLLQIGDVRLAASHFFWNASLDSHERSNVHGGNLREGRT